jgi:hypothetical protein
VDIQITWRIAAPDTGIYWNHLPLKEIFHSFEPLGNFELGGFQENEEPFHCNGVRKGNNIDLHGRDQAEQGFLETYAQAVDFDCREQDVTYLAEHCLDCFLIDD